MTFSDSDIRNHFSLNCVLYTFYPRIYCNQKKTVNERNCVFNPLLYYAVLFAMMTRKGGA
jgi:hypothetical protein